MMRTLLLHLALLVPALFVGAVEYEGYTNPAGTKFPIAIYDNVPISINRVQILSDAEQKAYFDSIRLAGFNVELWGKGDIWRKEPINKWTPYLKSLGMNTIISTRGFSLTRSATPYDPNTPDSILLEDNWDGLKTVISNYSQDPNVWGYWACDEPKMSRLHIPAYELNTNEATVLPTFERVHKFRGSKVAYANFAVAFNYDWIGDFASEKPDSIYIEPYENFLDYMVDVLDLKFLTFDVYPVISHSKGPEPAWGIKSFYYNSMDLYGRYCRDRKIPVWLVMLSVEHARYDKPGGEVDWEYPEITEGLLRMQAMNGLAFGMKGLVYWQYGAQNNWSGNTLYKSALYDTNKKTTTPAWKAAQTVNNEVLRYGAYLRNATYDSSHLVVKDSVGSYDGFELAPQTFGGIGVIKHTGNAVLISHLTADDYDYIAVVNQDYVNTQKITLAIEANSKYEQVQLYYTGFLDSADTNGNVLAQTVTYNLKPGGMLLFKKRQN